MWYDNPMSTKKLLSQFFQVGNKAYGLKNTESSDVGKYSTSNQRGNPRFTFAEFLGRKGYNSGGYEDGFRVWSDDPLIQRIIEVESSANPNTPPSNKGAIGLMQIMPGTASAYPGYIIDNKGKKISEKNFIPLTEEDLKNPEKNIEFGTSYIKGLVKHYGNERDAVAAYNFGPSRYTRFKKKGYWIDKEGIKRNSLPEETLNYVNKVLGPDVVPVKKPTKEKVITPVKRPEMNLGGAMVKPTETNISIQKQMANVLNAVAPKGHQLAYITPNEADMLKKAGGTGEMTKSGIRAYPPRDRGRGRSKSKSSSSQGGNPHGGGADHGSSSSSSSSSSSNQGKGGGADASQPDFGVSKTPVNPHIGTTAKTSKIGVQEEKKDKKNYTPKFLGWKTYSNLSPADIRYDPLGTYANVTSEGYVGGIETGWDIAGNFGTLGLESVTPFSSVKEGNFTDSDTSIKAGYHTDMTSTEASYNLDNSNVGIETSYKTGWGANFTDKAAPGFPSVGGWTDGLNVVGGYNTEEGFNIGIGTDVTGFVGNKYLNAEPKITINEDGEINTSIGFSFKRGGLLDKKRFKKA